MYKVQNRMLSKAYWVQNLAEVSHLNYFTKTFEMVWMHSGIKPLTELFSSSLLPREEFPQGTGPTFEPGTCLGTRRRANHLTQA